MSKPSYATYVKDRLAGFGGSGNTFVYQDLADFPSLGEARVRRPRPLAAKDAGLQTRRSRCAIARPPPSILLISRAALAAAGRPDAFMSAASPGVVSLFFRNDYYKDHETYLFAIADAMRHEYEAIAKRDRCCRSIVPISPWGGTSSMRILT